MKAAFSLMVVLAILPTVAAADPQIFQLCNHYDYTVYAAISEREPGPEGARVVKGWYAANPNQCAGIEIHKDYFYIHVRGRVGNQIRVTVPKPSADPVYDTQIRYCFDPNKAFEYHGIGTSYCPNGEREVFNDWYPDSRGWRWDLR